ncbi:MAG: hypothetical protein R2717_09855 [Schumannella sp.]
MGLQIGYAAMLEQFAPAEALELAAHAEANGFSGVMASDHYQPWVPQQGQASFVWSVLGALGQTTAGDLGTRVTTHLPVASRTGRLKRFGDPGHNVPRPALAGPGQRRGAQRARGQPLLAGCPRAHQPHVRGGRHHPRSSSRRG